MIGQRGTRWLLVCMTAGGCIAALAVLLSLAWHLTIAYCWQWPGLIGSQHSAQMPAFPACMARWHPATDQTVIAMSMLIALATCGRLLHHLRRHRPPAVARPVTRPD
ncbi:hypothetical protein [Xanthomonas euvesicatoria]|uniref:hypothetical protein n=1 Tax=Xanthomonas euvesicatoria TaxID=456327 RepID=UPI0004A3F718|nr:hypothetical protein [Xanthomonas euvesicatoria]